MRNFRFIVALLFVSTIGCADMPAQKEVSDDAYQSMLSDLLRHDVSEISIDEALSLKSPFFLDAREEEEFNVSHIENAIHVGYDHFDKSILKSLNQSDTIVVYCSVGYRSERITRKLGKEGFKNVYNLYGGIFEWKNLGNEVINDEGATNKVHAYDEYWGKWLVKGEKVF